MGKTGILHFQLSVRPLLVLQLVRCEMQNASFILFFGTILAVFLIMCLLPFTHTGKGSACWDCNAEGCHVGGHP
jgi:hypothetical protein